MCDNVHHNVNKLDRFLMYVRKQNLFFEPSINVVGISLVIQLGLDQLVEVGHVSFEVSPIIFVDCWPQGEKWLPGVFKPLAKRTLDHTIIHADYLAHSDLRVRDLGAFRSQVGFQALKVEVMAALAQHYACVMHLVNYTFQAKPVEYDICFLFFPVVCLFGWVFCFRIFGLLFLHQFEMVYTRCLPNISSFRVQQTLLLVLVSLDVAVIE